jgi:hypothetical protein
MNLERFASEGNVTALNEMQMVTEVETGGNKWGCRYLRCIQFGSQVT